MSDNGNESLALLKLSMCKGVSSGTILSLVEAFGSAEAALGASADALGQLPGVRPAAVRSLLDPPRDAAVERELDLMERYRVRLVPFTSEDYPRPLRHLDSGAPALLRIRGEYRREDQLAVAVVGARRCSSYGRQQGSRFGADLAAMGITVVSGMATGVDRAAHRGAIMAKGRTLAVLGCGLAHALGDGDPGPAVDIIENGALISELPMDAPPLPGNFPPRNRIISGLSLAVVVVEAAARSGSLITARHAAEQGRFVFAVPGPVDSPTSHGCHQLIRDGATLAESARDVVEGLGPLSDPIDLPAEDSDEAAATVHDARVMALSDRQREVLEIVERSPLHIDDVVARTGLAVSIVSSTLLTLEIRGLVKQLSGQRYVRS